jgi:hypothetical protein
VAFLSGRSKLKRVGTWASPLLNWMKADFIAWMASFMETISEICFLFKEITD